MTSTTKKRLSAYIQGCLNGFKTKPAKNEFDRGYWAAYHEMFHLIENLPDEVPAIPTSTAQACSTGAPPWARNIWFDVGHIYLEFPMANAAPYIMKFSSTEGGLTEALNIMKRLYQDCDVDARQHYRKPEGGYTVKRTRKANVPASPATEAQAKAVREILRKGGYLK